MSDAHRATGAGTSTISPGWRERLFVSNEYFSLWVAQVVSATGDWVGFFAITALAANISRQPEAATALVLTARVAPSFFLAPFMGVLADRFDRKLLMQVSDVARALVFVALPFVHTLWGLIVASLLLEVFTLMFSPAKEALTPSLVPRERLTTANSLSLLAAYGTMPFAGIVQYLLKAGNDALAGVSWLAPLQFDASLGDTQALAFYFNAVTFVVTAIIVWRCIHTRGAPGAMAAPEVGAASTDTAPSGFRKTFHDIAVGWRLILRHPVLRAVNVGLACGLIGGAMLVPLGASFAKKVLGDPNAYSLFITALGFGVAVGVAALTAFQQRLPKERVFVGLLVFTGLSLGFAVSMSGFWPCAIGVFGLGVGAGAVYVLGFTLIGEHTDDELRGRVFSTLLTLVRFCVLLSLLAGPAISALIDPLMERLVGTTDGVATATLFGMGVAVPGVRVTLWLASAVILVAAALAARSMRAGMRAPRMAPDVDVAADLVDAGNSDGAAG